MSVRHYDIYQQICSPSSSQCISLLLIVFRRFFMWNEPGDVDLRFSLILLLKRKLNEPHDYITSIIS